MSEVNLVDFIEIMCEIYMNKVSCTYINDNLQNRTWPFPPHLYIDANSDGFTMMKGSFNDTQEALYHTLQQAYNNHNSQVSLIITATHS